ncbi:hypothetical protein [Pseudonocardia asaccharolytica]|nr:hypothetical protein [Pseudonocardia asaccharolytica]
MMRTKLGDRAPSTPSKFALGVIGMGVAFLLFLPMAGGTGKTSPAIAVFFLMALYFFSVGIGTSTAGVLARFYSPAHEVPYFGISGAVTIVVGLIVLSLVPWIRGRMEGVH